MSKIEDIIARLKMAAGTDRDLAMMLNDNGRLFTAASDLLSCQTMGASMNTPDFLDWISARLINLHGENPNSDFILSLRERAAAGRAAIAKVFGDQS